MEVTVGNYGTLQLNEKHIEEKLDHKNLRAITRKYCTDYRKQGFELVDK